MREPVSIPEETSIKKKYRSKTKKKFMDLNLHHIIALLKKNITY